MLFLDMRSALRSTLGRTRNSSPYNTQLLIFNTIGEVIFKTAQIGGFVTDTFTLSTSELPEGVYFVQIFNGNRTEQKKFVVHH
jgi:hypothetical protein